MICRLVDSALYKIVVKFCSDLFFAPAQKGVLVFSDTTPVLSVITADTMEFR